MTDLFCPLSAVETSNALQTSWDFLQKGGIFMIPLGITSIVGMTAILYKFLALARNRVIERHPGTTFIGLHVGNRSEDLGEVSSLLDRYPNFHVEIGARLGELGRQPRRSRRFFEEYPDRIMFGRLEEIAR